MAKSSDLTPEQRAEIVLSLLRKEEPASVPARRHGISANTLGQWREGFIAGGVANLASGKRRKREEAQRLSDLKAAVKERAVGFNHSRVVRRENISPLFSFLRPPFSWSKCLQDARAPF